MYLQHLHRTCVVNTKPELFGLDITLILQSPDLGPEIQVRGVNVHVLCIEGIDSYVHYAMHIVRHLAIK